MSSSSSVWDSKKYTSRWYKVAKAAALQNQSHIICLQTTKQDCDTVGAWFVCSGYVNRQNNVQRGTENPHAVHGVPMHDLQVGL